MSMSDYIIYSRDGIPISDNNGNRFESFNGEMVIIACQIRGYDLEDVHEYTQIPMMTLGQLERSLTQPTVDQLKALGKFLDFPVAFFYREGRREPSFICRNVGQYDEDGNLPIQLLLI